LPVFEMQHMESSFTCEPYNQAEG